MSEALITSSGLRLEVAGLTDVGQVREHNEDCLGIAAAHYEPCLADYGCLFAVADGMGGHSLGDIASQLAIDALYDTYYHAEPDPPLALYQAIGAANEAVHYQASLRGVTMGTTLTVAVIHDAMLIVANVGDSRVYRLRDGRAQQLTQDHSLISEQLRRGLITYEQAEQSQMKNVITRSIGFRSSVEIDINESPVRVDDVILLCSDGLHGLLTPAELAAVVGNQPLGFAAQTLINLANLRGGPDNVSCLLVRVVALPDLPDPAEEAPSEAADDTDELPVEAADEADEADESGANDRLLAVAGTSESS